MDHIFDDLRGDPLFQDLLPAAEPAELTFGHHSRHALMSHHRVLDQGPLSLDQLRASPNALAPHYSAFRVEERLLMTGHSHQAWPDVGFEGQKRAWLDAAEHADGKWDGVAEKTERVAEGFRRLMGGCDGDLTVDTNTHALVVRFLSALPLRERRRIVTTDGEFHSIRRQLDRLAEDGLEVVKVASDPLDSLAERVAAEVDDRTACVMISSVLFGSGLIVEHLPAVADACARHGAELLIDAYHSLGVVPFSLDDMANAYVVAGGYKYCQLGEGNCVLRRATRLRAPPRYHRVVQRVCRARRRTPGR